MNLEELEVIATEQRNLRDSITRKLHEIVSEIDKRKASESVKEIVSGLSEDQKREMYAQIIGVNAAKSGAKGVKSNG